MPFLPLNREELRKAGWEQPDFVYVIGDAYVDHSSFGPAIISRVLESRGYKVAILSQPDWRNPESIAEFGEPRLAFLVSAGNMDSMVNHYTVAKKRRSEDAYSPGGQAGLRPDYATVVYCNLIRRKYKKKPVLIGGIEASLRRLAHYDYWADRIKRSILLDSGADLLLYGMGERAIVEVAEALDADMEIADVVFVRGTVYKTRDVSGLSEAILLPSFDSLRDDPRNYAESFAVQYRNTDYHTARPLVEQYGEHRYLVQNPPAKPLSTQEMDDIYELPYMNDCHPSYAAAGGVPAIREIRFSLTSNRGCFGGCSFCALAFHQGRVLQVRSHDSLIREAERMTRDPAFQGYLHDVGGPTANFRQPACGKQREKGVCPDRQCLFPKPCKNLTADHTDYIRLLRKLRKLPKVKKVFIRSGIRFDYVLADQKTDFLKELCRYHVSGQLRVAPEHVSEKVLALMGKPEPSVYRTFCQRFEKVNRELGMEQYVLPYLMSSHPGSGLAEAIELAEYIRDLGYMPEQVQDFYPTPSTLSTVMYCTGVDPRTMQSVYVPRSPHEKALQRALIQYRRPENYELVKEALLKAGRTDLIGFDRKKCLIPPRRPQERRAAGAEGQRADSVTLTRTGKSRKLEKTGTGQPGQNRRKDSGSRPGNARENVRRKDSGSRPGNAREGVRGKTGKTAGEKPGKEAGKAGHKKAKGRK